MRISGLFHSGRANRGITQNGGTIAGLLQLDSMSNNPLSAITKTYLDNALVNLDASNIVSGTIASNRLPSFSGDLVSSGSPTNLLLPIQPGVGGTYTKVTVNANGVVTAGVSIDINDIPNLSFNKINSGKPTTLAGYGILNAIPSAGGTMTGSLSIGTAPSSANHIATKNYIDTLVPGSSSPVGTILMHCTSTPPTGYLRLDGTQISRTTYANLYSVLGDAGGYRTVPGNGQPWKHQNSVNSLQGGDLGSWSAGTVLPGALGGSAAIVTKNRVYLLGGFTGSAVVNVIYTAPINADGTIGTWASAGTIPASLNAPAVSVTKNYVYLFGGSDGTNPVSTTYKAPIDSDGTIGSWTAGTSLPAPLMSTHAVILGNKIYLLGGRTTGNALVTTVYSATIDANGVIGSWASDGTVPYGGNMRLVAVTHKRIYLFTGYTSSYTSNVYSAPINPDNTIGTWVSGTAFPVTLGYGSCFTTKTHVYVLGGYSPSAYRSTTYYAPINADGTIGTWVSGTSIGGANGDASVVVTNNHVYLLGGRAASYTSVTRYAVIGGGSNDYSQYYDGSITIVDAANFKLPDYTTTDMPGTYSFIKY